MSVGLPTSPTTRRTRTRLITATRAEIAATGSFTAERVAARAGSSPATFYAYFPSKADALTAAFGEMLDELVVLVDRLLVIEALLDRGLDGFCDDLVRGALDFFRAQERLFRCALAALPESKPLRDLYRQHEREALERSHRFVRRAQRAGAVRRGETDAIAVGLLVLLQGLNNPQALRGRPREPLRAELARAFARFLTTDGA